MEETERRRMRRRGVENEKGWKMGRRKREMKDDKERYGREGEAKRGE